MADPLTRDSVLQKLYDQYFDSACASIRETLATYNGGLTKCLAYDARVTAPPDVREHVEESVTKHFEHRGWEIEFREFGPGSDLRKVEIRAKTDRPASFPNKDEVIERLFRRHYDALVEVINKGLTDYRAPFSIHRGVCEYIETPLPIRKKVEDALADWLTKAGWTFVFEKNNHGARVLYISHE